MSFKDKISEEMSVKFRRSVLTEVEKILSERKAKKGNWIWSWQFATGLTICILVFLHIGRVNRFSQDFQVDPVLVEKHELLLELDLFEDLDTIEALELSYLNQNYE